MRRLADPAANEDGAAAIEMALWTVAIVVPLLSATDIGIYSYQRMQVENAAQMAAQAAWQYCSTGAMLPVVQNCSNLLTVMTTAAQNTTLGTNVTVPATSVTEGFYCTDSSGALVSVGTTGTLSPLVSPSRPASNNCNSVLGSGAVPGDYVQVTATYTYTPVFGRISVASLLPGTISRQAWMRLQ
jgi:Flp pilus assembly protein TadG